MKRKIKAFLNKRVISAAISAAMTFNMAALLPMGVFADDNLSDESNEKITYFGDNKYQLFDESMSWTDAKNYCENLGGHLATVTSAEEQATIEKLISSGSKNSYWLGATDELIDGEWVWVTGEEFSYANWSNSQPDNGYSGAEDYLGISRVNQGWANTNEWNDFLVNAIRYDGGFICEWDGNNDKIEEASPYTIFSGSNTENFQLNCWKSTFNGNVYTGACFVSNASELYLTGKVDAVNTITTNGWQINIDERNENVEKEAMPDWDARIHKMAGSYEFTDEDVVRIQDKNVIDGAVKTTGKVEISGTTFDGNCYIIADGDITYNVNEFVSTGHVVLYSRNGNITINGTNIDMNGIMYAPNGTVAFNSNIANINGRIFADKINFSGSIFNVTGSDSDWELLGTKTVISKTYTLNDDFNEGEFDGLCLDVADELTLEQHSDNDNVSSENSYNESGTWTAVYDSNTTNTVWKNIYWNGKLYDDGKITVKACAGNDQNSFGDWVDVANYENIENLSGRYVKLSVEMNVSSTGKTPELFDITLLSDGADNVNYINNAPETKIIGFDTACVNKKLFLSSETTDDAFCTQLDFKWSCDNENVIISNSNKPCASFKFNESGEYAVTLTVSDGNSQTVVSKMITVLNDEVMITPIIDIESPSVVKVGSVVSGKINNLNGAQISEYEIKVGNDSVSADEDGNFTFTAPENDCIISINVKAANALGLYGESSKAIIVDGTAPSVELRTDSDKIHANDTVTVAAVMSDENGIKDYTVTLNGEEITLNENYQYIFTPETAGEYVFVLNAEDIVGNSSDTTLVINVSKEEFEDTNQPVVKYSVPKMLMVGESGNFRFIASDDTGVAEFAVKVNGVAVDIDENGCFSYVPEKSGNLVLDIHAADEAGNNTDFQLTVPVITLDLVTEKTTYKENELVNVQLVYSDNLNIKDQQAAIDGIQKNIETDKISAEGLSVGTHQIVWQIQDECGAVFTGTLEIKVVDSTAPEVSVILSDNNPKDGDTVTAEITASDEHGIASVTAMLDGNEISVNDGKAVLENLTAGKHTLEVTATDNTGNYNVYTYKFNVLSNQSVDTAAPELDVTVGFTEDKNIEITAVATDESGYAEITATVNGEEVVFENGKAVYTPNGVGDYVIIVRAEDESGNYTEKTQTVTIIREDSVFELKLGVSVEKDNISPNETTNLIVSTSSTLGKVSLSCTSNGGTIAENEDGFSFVSDKTGTFELVVTATDDKGNTVSHTVYINVAEDKVDIGNDDEETGVYENEYTPEARARVILDSNEKTETKMTEEMADLADHLETPLAVYEYLYNNLNTEYYIGSRKGGIGAYEQKGGNDVDCSSLLIAMLRYLDYEADYVTGNVIVTSDQLMGLTATDTIENAENVYTLLGKPLTRYNGKYIIERTWVKTVVDGNEYQLDVNFKKFTPSSGISDEIEAQNLDLDFKDYTSLSEADALFNEYKNQVSLTDVNLSGRKLVNKKITKLPLNLPYICDNISEEIHNICDSEIVTTDSITIGFSDDVYSITSPMAFISSISIEYVPSSDFYNTVGDILDISKPSSIYASISASDSYIVANQKNIVPALYIDNQKVYEWNSRVSIGDKQQMVIITNTNGQEKRYTESRELIVGSIVSIVVDTQVISPQSLLTAYENYKKIKDTINENNFFESSYCDNYLNLIGNVYFAQLDIQNTIYSSAYNIYKERELSFGLFNYEPNVETKSVIGYTASTTLTKQGHFGLDILGVYNQAISLSGNENDVKSYMFASGYVSSYLESQTLQQFTGVKSISTAEVFRQCNEKGIDLKMVSSENKEIIETLQISTEDKAEITQKVNDGYLVIVPEKNITIDQWTGTAYIVQSRDGTQNTFVITGDKNGGYSTEDIVSYMIIATIGSGVDMYGTIFGFVGIISALLALPVVPFIAYAAAATAMVVFAKLVIMWIEDYQETVDLYFRALDGDVEAANRLNGKAFIATVSMFFDFATGGFNGSKGAGPDDVPTPGGRKTNLSNKGYADDVVDDIFKMKNVDSCSDDLLESIAKSGKSADVAETLSKYSDDVIEALNKSSDKDAVISLIAKHGDDAVQISAKSSPEALKAISNLSDDAAESFFKTAGKHGDELASAINKSANIDDAVSFISNYKDYGAEIFLRHGDDAIIAVKGCDAPYKAVEIIKNGGLQYGEQAVQAIKKSGDKAVEALTKVPTKDCAELIARHGDDAANIFTNYGKEAVSAVKNCSSPKQAIKSINAVGEDAVKAINRVPTEECASAIYRFNGAAKVISDYGDDALDAITKADALKNVDSTIEAITKRGENAVFAFKNASPTKECSDLLITYGDDAAEVISTYGDDAVNAISKCNNGKRNAISVIKSHGQEGIRIADKGGEKLAIAVSNADNITQKQFVQFAQSQNDEFIQSIGKWTATDDAIEMSLKYKEKSVSIIEKYCDDQVIGLSKAMNSESTAITFVRDPNGIVHVAGSGNYNFNPSISVPENYLNPNVIDSEYYFQKYNNLLTEDGIKMMNVSEATATELRKLNEAVENTKQLAKSEAKDNPDKFIYKHGDSEEFSFVSSHSVSNCGEVWSAREAILNGAKFDELDLSTYCNNGTGQYGVGDYMPKCENCQHTFGGN